MYFEHSTTQSQNKKLERKYISFIKRLIFHLLLTFRPLILCISKWLALMWLFMTVALFCFAELQHVPFIVKIIAIGLTIIFTFINWFYDELIFYFTPPNKEIALFR